MSSDPDIDWNLKLSLGKIPVVPLNQASDFPHWHLAVRRLVTACNMADTLLSLFHNTNWQKYERVFRLLKRRLR